MLVPDYKGFIEHYFNIKTKEGDIVPFLLNDVQNHYYSVLDKEYPDWQGIRENDLKARQEGFSSLIDAIFTVDFILSALGELPVLSGQIISHKKEETKPLFQRIDLYLNSYLAKENLSRDKFLKTDNNVSYMEAYSGASLFVGTAGAKTLGRGGTLQNIHWSECAFYPNTEILNAEDLVIGAEQQVKDDIGKIFRESTGNRKGDFFYNEYEDGKKGEGQFKSRFFPWFLFGDYQKPVPDGFEFTPEQEAKIEKYQISREQMYWHIRKTTATDEDKQKKRVREYPFEDRESFLSSGEYYFDAEAMERYELAAIDPVKEGLIYA